MLAVLMTKKTLNLRVWLALAGWLLLPQILVSSPWVNGASRPVEYGWDAWDRLREVKVPTTATAQKIYRYSYDYRMRRIAMAQTGGGLTTRHTAVLYSGGLSVVEYNRTNNNTITNSTLSSMQYVRGPDMGGGVGGLLYTFRRSGDSLVQRFNLSNGRGDIVAQTSSTGALTWTASYEAYGKQTKETGTNNDRQRANSKEEDPTGLLNEGHRYRDLETGVWMSRDPAGFVDGPNLYAYVRQNPWTSFDPHGLQAAGGAVRNPVPQARQPSPSPEIMRFWSAVGRDVGRRVVYRYCTNEEGYNQSLNITRANRRGGGPIVVPYGPGANGGATVRDLSGRPVPGMWPKFKPGSREFQQAQSEAWNNEMQSRAGEFSRGQSPNSSSPQNAFLEGQTPVPGTRGTGVARAARQEVELVQKTGRGTTAWTPEQIEFIRQNNRLPPGTVGHHTNNVQQYPAWSGDPRNITIVPNQSANLNEHAQNYKNPTQGPLIDRPAMIQQGTSTTQQ